MTGDKPSERGADFDPAGASPQTTSAENIASLKAAWRRGLSLDAPDEPAVEQPSEASDPAPAKL